MTEVTFQVLEGIDKGRVFRKLETPVTIGREEGNVLRLNDERVSRFHAKVQYDGGEVILTDLDSTNGTRVNGNVIQIRRLRPGDRVGLGRSLLLFGSDQEIQERRETLNRLDESAPQSEADNAGPPPTVHAHNLASLFDHDADYDLNPKESITETQGTIFIGNRPLPPLPQKLTPAQAARLAELLDFLHRHLSNAVEHIDSNEEATEVKLTYSDWQKVLALQLVLARYVRGVGDPESLEE